MYYFGAPSPRPGAICMLCCFILFCQPCDCNSIPHITRHWHGMGIHSQLSTTTLVLTICYRQLKRIILREKALFGIWGMMMWSPGFYPGGWRGCGDAGMRDCLDLPNYCLLTYAGGGHSPGNGDVDWMTEWKRLEGLKGMGTGSDKVWKYTYLPISIYLCSCLLIYIYTFTSMHPTPPTPNVVPLT